MKKGKLALMKTRLTYLKNLCSHENNYEKAKEIRKSIRKLEKDIKTLTESC